MIKIKEVGFSNMFSYGADNIFTVGSSVTQLLGKNGDGKSSIAAIIEELFYNKNSRGIKKADIPNRYTEEKGYSCWATFTVDNIPYRLEKVVQSSTKLTLLRDGVDISGHTTTQTYKSLESLLRMDFNTFTKLVYQSMVSSLDFLSATDANRKKFLVSLLGLEIYVEAEKTLKDAVKASKVEVASIEGSLRTVQSWVDTNGVISEVPEPVEVPEQDPKLAENLVERKAELSSISMHNKVVSENLSNISKRDSIVQVPETQPPTKDIKSITADLAEAREALAVVKSRKSTASSEVSKISAIKEKCHVCGSNLEVGNKEEMLVKATDVLNHAVSQVDSATERVNIAEVLLSEVKAEVLAYTKYENYLSSVESAEARLDSTKPTEFLDSETLTKTITSLKNTIATVEEQIKKATKHNANVSVEATKAEYQKQQLTKFQEELKVLSGKLDTAQVLNFRLDVLAKALGTKGLIAYKVESMVKVFEALINKYLQVLSDGDFALGFSVEETKLVLNTYSRGKPIDIRSLSSGEFNRVNTATLLAVRKMMTSISKTDINLLILDEVVSVLDAEGKDTLIAVLLQEHNLSSIVVSHGYEHPLADKILVVKENNISRLNTDE